MGPGCLAPVCPPNNRPFSEAAFIMTVIILILGIRLHYNHHPSSSSYYMGVNEAGPWGICAVLGKGAALGLSQQWQEVMIKTEVKGKGFLTQNLGNT